MMMLLRLNKQLVPELTSLREAEVEINARTQSRKKAVTYKVNARGKVTEPHLSYSGQNMG